jgi:hypothetical protein
VHGGWLVFRRLPPCFWQQRRHAAQAGFPFEHEMLLDVRPLPRSRRVPILEIFADGRAQIDLWCRSGPAWSRSRAMR